MGMKVEHGYLPTVHELLDRLKVLVAANVLPEFLRLKAARCFE